MTPGQKIYVKEDGVRLRKTKDTTAGATLLSKDCELTFMSLEFPWIKATANGQMGWVHGDYVYEKNSVSPVAPAMPIPTAKSKWCAPIRADKFKVTQKFLTPDAGNYPKTGHHPGTDYGTQGQDNVPLYFCADGEIIESGDLHKFFGNYFFFYVAEVDRTFVYFHLRDSAPKKGKYKAGDQCGITGNTGLSFGAHLHLECMKGKKTSADRAALYISKDALALAAEDPDPFIRARL